MKHFKLIKEYPGSPKLGFIYPTDSNGHRYAFHNHSEYPEFWKELKEKKFPSFTTEDGIKLNIGDNVYTLNSKTLTISSKQTAVSSDCDQEKARESNWLWFHDRKKAEEYIIMNKKCLSLKDIQDATGNGIGCTNMRKIEKIVESRL